MTVETMSVPAQPVPGPGVPAAGPATAGQYATIPAAGPLWRRALARAAAVPLVVLAPLVGLAPTADQRFNIYWHGALFRDDPLRIVPHTIGTLRSYLGMGNFRPLGRMLEKSLDLTVFTMSDVLGLPANVGLRLVSFVAAIVLTLAATVLVDSVVARGRLFRRPPSTLAALTPFAVGAGFVAAGASSTTVLFSGLYVGSTALVVGVAAAACRAVTEDAGRLTRGRALLAVVAGAGLASFNEVVYLAPPVATAAVLLRGRWVLRQNWREVLTGRGARLLAALWGGFLPVFVAVRAVILSHCRSGGCYRGSDVTLGAGAAEALPVRLISWWPPLMWDAAVRGGPGRWVSGIVPVVALLVLALLARGLVRDVPRLTPVGRGPALAVATAASVLLVLAATMAALNGDVQAVIARGNWGQGWRDTAATATAGAILVLALMHALVLREPRDGGTRGAGPPARAVLGRLRADRRWAVALVAVLLVVAGAVSAAANKRYRDVRFGDTPDLLANRVAEEMANFDTSAAGDRRRCALQREFELLYPDLAFSQRRFDEALDAAAEQLAGSPFCAGAVVTGR